jgi:hypothetical protein
MRAAGDGGSIGGRALVSAAPADLLGHRDVSTTMICTHVLNRGGRRVRSPLDS